MYPLLTNINSQFIDDCGKPLAGGKVYTYEANTTTPKPTYADIEGLAVNTNPIILDESGRANIHLDTGAYRIRVLNKKGALIADTPEISRYVVRTELDTFIAEIQSGVDELNQIKETLDTVTDTAINNQKGVADGLAPLNSEGLVDISYLPKGFDFILYLPIPYPLATPPTGFILMDGSDINHETQPNLSALYGAKLPDMRGLVIRGLDNGKGIDTGRAVLSVQEDAIKTHTLKTMVGGDNNGVRGADTNAATTSSTGPTSAWGDVQVKYDGATETRMKNMAWNYIVKNG